MASLNRSYAEYVPQDVPEFAVPVQQGEVYNLTVAITPDRQAILGWTDFNEDEFRCAVVPIFEDIFNDDIVPPGDVRTVLAVDNIRHGSVWCWEGTLYAFVGSIDPAGTGQNEVYVADDPENPVTWTLLATIDTVTAGTAFFLPTVYACGQPTVTEQGNWLLAMEAWRNFLGILDDGVGVFSSQDNGATWETEVNFRKAAGEGATAGPESTSVAFIPDLDIYRWGTDIGPLTTWHYWSSDDNTGVGTWTVTSQSGGSSGYNPYFYIDNGTSVFAGLAGGGSMNIYEIPPGGDYTDPTTWIDTNCRGIVATGIGQEPGGFNIAPMSWPTNTDFLGVVFTAKDRIAYHPLCVPIAPDPLYIPYKDRLLKTEITDNTSATDASIAVSQEHQFDNYKIVERWGNQYMKDTNSGDACGLFIPWKEHSLEEPELSASQSWENWKYIERWGQAVDAGVCGCACVGAQDPPDRCALHIPWKDHLVGVDPLDEDAWRTAGEHEFDNWKTLERWANRYASGECGCTA